MIQLTGEILGQEVLNRAFSRLVASSNNFSEVFVKIGEDVRDIEKEQFDAEGNGWEALSPAYGAWKEIHFPGQTILRRTDRLYQSMTSTSGEDNVNETGPLEAAFGARGPSGVYGRYHQLGTSKMPQRKVFDFTEENKRLFTHTVHLYMIRLGEESGFGVN